MNWLKTNFSVLFSPVFWGLTLSALFAVAELYAWLTPELMAILYKWAVGVTGVGIIWKTAKKISGK